MKKEIDLLKNENENLKNKMKEKFLEFDDLLQEEKNKKNRERELKNYLIGESISTIKYFKDYSLIVNGIKSQLTNLKHKTLILKLIYKSSINGQNAKDFHYYCDNKGPTVSIIKTKNNVIFGGFLNINQSDKGGTTRDENSFLFSFNNNKIYKNNKKENAGKFYKGLGPYFCYGINISEDFKQLNKHEVRTREDSKLAWNSFAYDYELNDGDQYFNIEEIEVFQVLC